MKTPKGFNRILLFIVSLSLTLSSCLDNKYDDINSSAAAGFDFKTTKEYSVTVSALSATDSPVKGAIIHLYTENPVNSDGVLTENAKASLVFTGVTSANGLVTCKIAPATYADSLYVQVDYIGLPTSKVVPLSAENLNITIGGSNAKQQANAARMISKAATAIPSVTKTADGKYYVLGSWNSAGVPNYLWTPNDVISADLLADINASLPERIALPVSHPEYLENSDDGSLVLVEDAEVWITFVHEGAGNLNSFLYYTHPTATPPATANAISNPVIVYPNVSYSGSGGGLASGNKVQLFYLDPVTKKFTNVFPAGTTVAWIFRSSGWNGSTVSSGTPFYSDVRFNPETNAAKKKHNVLLKDNSRKLLIMGFEDLNREGSSDNDFNDGVFYATVTPYTAVKSNFYKVIDSPKDTDNDGVGDSSDEYPTDPTKAFNNYYPSEGGTATLAFEDMWPLKGDYDFNDMVVDYNINQITNASNKVVEINSKLTVRAIGASYTNGFGFQFNTSSANIKSVTGQVLTEGIVKNLTTGAEASQSKAVVIAFDNAFKLLKRSGTGVGANTVQGDSYTTPQPIILNVKFNTPVDFSDMGTPPYNPFIFVSRNRAKEIHLPASQPTDLADKSLLGTGDDDSDPAKGKYYMSDRYLPWAINLPVKFDYPAEKEDITKAYLLFNSWAASNGYRNMDWYLDKSGYRSSSKLYQIK